MTHSSLAAGGQSWISVAESRLSPGQLQIYAACVDPVPNTAPAEKSPGDLLPAAHRECVLLSEIFVQSLNRNHISRLEDRGFLWATPLSAGGRDPCAGAALPFPLSPHPRPSPFPPAHPPVPRAARSPQGLPFPSARTEKQQCLRVYRFCTSRRRRTEGGQAALNLPGIGVAAGRRERRCPVCPRAHPGHRSRDCGERLSRPWQKGLLPRDCQLGAVLALETLMCFCLLLWGLCPAVRAGVV